jgi:hypothetical protein
MLRGHVKSYVSESIKSTNSQPPDIHDFDLQIEISKIHPVLWNFIFRMTAKNLLKKICFSKMSLDPIAYDQLFSSLLDLILQVCLFLICYARWKSAEKMLRKDTFDWENHYVKCSPTQRNIENIRFFPRLFISSCIFNTFH